LALEHWWRIAPQPDEQAAHALLYRRGPQSFADRVSLAWARSPAGAADGAWRDLARLPQRWTAPVFSLKAADFIRRGVAAGPPLGAALHAAEAAWIAADFPADRAAIDAIADRAAQETAVFPAHSRVSGNPD
jgi:poly(A) polymerase